MAEKTLYTALGHFRCRNDGGGRRYPVILMDHREFGMDPQEMTLWTALCWRLTDRQRAEDFYEQLSNGMELFPRRSFSDCLDRLVTRGLVAKGSGTTDFDALYDLLGGLYVVPISSSFPLKVVTFLKLLCSGTAPGSASALFRRDRRTEPERHIMALSRCAPLSTAELVRWRGMRYFGYRRQSADACAAVWRSGDDQRQHRIGNADCRSLSVCDSSGCQSLSSQAGHL